jgi:hypothetical protein
LAVVSFVVARFWLMAACGLQHLLWLLQLQPIFPMPAPVVWPTSVGADTGRWWRAARHQQVNDQHVAHC